MNIEDIAYGMVSIPCSLCGKDHEAMVIHGHISQPHMCEDCFRKLAEEWRKERKESVDNGPNNQ